MNLELMQQLSKPADSKIVLLVMDGLGGLPVEPYGPTALEAANTPNLDELADQGICGLHVPIAPGITPGSGPAHLALFGYDPLKYDVGRGVLSALGVDFDLQPQDVAARGNYATVDEQGQVSDRRAGRISTEKNQELTQQLQQIELPGTELFVQTVKEHRFLLVLRGQGLSGEINDTDPQQLGVPPEQPQALKPAAEKTVGLVKEFINQAQGILKDHHPANMVLLRGFSQLPDWPSFPDVFGVQAAAIAAYPMYRGVAKLVGMDALHAGDTLDEEITLLEENWNQYDFFFMHVKKTDSYGEDGNFERKVELIEEVDTTIPRLMNLKPDVLLVTGDHSTPALLKAHGWQPVPVLLWSRYCRRDEVSLFGERTCMNGGLGANFPAAELMPLAMANALRLEKYGA